jgi:hypothetical protein
MASLSALTTLQYGLKSPLMCVVLNFSYSALNSSLKIFLSSGSLRIFVTLLGSNGEIMPSFALFLQSYQQAMSSAIRAPVPAGMAF